MAIRKNAAWGPRSYRQLLSLVLILLLLASAAGAAGGRPGWTASGGPVPEYAPPEGNSGVQSFFGNERPHSRWLQAFSGSIGECMGVFEPWSSLPPPERFASSAKDVYACLIHTLFTSSDL